MQLALPSTDLALRSRLRLPPVVPPFNKRTYRIFTAIWVLALLLAVTGTAVGFYYRYIEPANNSLLLPGSRAGFAVAPRDATLVRFIVGPQAQAAGIVPGDHITAIYGLPLPRTMPISTDEELSEHNNDPAYIAMGNLLYGSDQADVPLTIRDPNGRVRDVTVTTGEQHIDAGARALGISPRMLSFIDLLHVLAYPFLFITAWLLHRRNSKDVVSSVLSLAILFTIAAEQPSTLFLSHVGAHSIDVALYDLGNVLLLAGILLFPHGNLSWRRLGVIVCLPALFFLEGSVYKTFLVAFMIIAVLSLVRWLQKTESSEQRQQIRWALLGISGYAVLLCLSIVCDYVKWTTDSFGHQLLVEMAAGISYAFAGLILQLGLLIALLRYRLYDAEVVIGRSVNFAVITLGVAAIFAAAGDALKQIVYNYSGNTNNEGPIIFAAALATIMVNPIQERVQRWSEKRFQKNLFLLRNDLPQSVRDMRETASLGEMLEEILAQVDRGVRSVRAAVIVNGCVLSVRGLTTDEVESWRTSVFAQDYKSDLCEPSDRLFPIRVPLVPSSDKEEPIGHLLVGPRPDGSIPSHAEQHALDEVSEDVARAIRTVIKREAREAEVAELIADNSRRIEALEALLGGERGGRKRSTGTA